MKARRRKANYYTFGTETFETLSQACEGVESFLYNELDALEGGGPQWITGPNGQRFQIDVRVYPVPWK